MKYFYLLFFIGLNVFSQDGLSIKKKKQFYIHGNTTVVGNNILSEHATNPLNDNTVVNDKVKMKYVDIDGDNTTFSSSQATLSIPKSSTKIVYAALYWSAIYKYDKGKLKRLGDNFKYKGDASARDSIVNKIKFKTPNNSYIAIEGEVIYDDLNNKVFPTTTPYVCYADVTDILNETQQVNGDYIVANVKGTQGYISGGSAGGWLLYVVYENPTDKPVYVSTYDGFVQVTKDNHPSIVFKDFITKEKGNVNTNLTIASLEGDYKLKSDQCLVLNPKDSTYIPLGNSIRSDKNVFNSKITNDDYGFENRKPFSENTLGFDLLRIQLPNKNNDLVSNNRDQITLKVKTKSDRFYMFFVAFQTDISQSNYTQSKNINPDSFEAISIDDDSEKSAELSPIKVTENLKKETIIVKQNSEIKLEKQNTVTTAVIEERGMNSTLVEFSNEKEKIIHDILQSTSGIIPSLEKGYYLTTNVFANHQNTLNWVKFLKSKGYSPKVIVNPVNNWEYVYVGNNQDLDIAYNELKELLKLPYFYGLWIFKVNLP